MYDGACEHWILYSWLPVRSIISLYEGNPDVVAVSKKVAQHNGNGMVQPKWFSECIFMMLPLTRQRPQCYHYHVKVGPVSDLIAIATARSSFEPGNRMFWSLTGPRTGSEWRAPSLPIILYPEFSSDGDVGYIDPTDPWICSSESLNFLFKYKRLSQSHACLRVCPGPKEIHS